jgi:hypothetical protein
MRIEVEVDEKSRQHELGERIKKAGWALFLIMIGVLWILPESSFPDGSWLVGSGILILGVQLVRRLAGLAVSGGMLVFGGLVLGLGLGDVYGLNIPIFSSLLILLGLFMLFEIIFRRQG